MNEIVDIDRASDPVRRRERGVEAYARIFDLPEKAVPAAIAGRVGQVFAEVGEVDEPQDLRTSPFVDPDRAHREA